MATDKLRKASSTGVATIAAVKTIRNPNATTLAIKTGGLTNWATSTSVDFNTYKLTGNVITNLCSWTGRVDIDNNLINELVLTSGTDVGNAVDDVVVCVETAAWVNDTISALLTIFDQTGTLKSNIIASSAIINQAVGTTKIADLAVTIGKIDLAARKQSLDINGTTEIVFSTAATQPAAQSGKTIIWFAPSS